MGCQGSKPATAPKAGEQQAADKTLLQEPAAASTAVKPELAATEVPTAQETPIESPATETSATVAAVETVQSPEEAQEGTPEESAHDASTKVSEELGVADASPTEQNSSTEMPCVVETAAVEISQAAENVEGEQVAKVGQERSSFSSFLLYFQVCHSTQAQTEIVVQKELAAIEVPTAQETVMETPATDPSATVAAGEAVQSPEEPQEGTVDKTLLQEPTGESKAVNLELAPTEVATAQETPTESPATETSATVAAVETVQSPEEAQECTPEESAHDASMKVSEELGVADASPTEQNSSTEMPCVVEATAVEISQAAKNVEGEQVAKVVEERLTSLP